MRNVSGNSYSVGMKVENYRHKIIPMKTKADNVFITGDNTIFFFFVVIQGRETKFFNLSAVSA